MCSKVENVSGRTSFPPPRRPGQTRSPPSGQAAEAQEFRHFRRAAVDLARCTRARKLSLMPGFLRGCSLRPFGTRSSFAQLINDLAECGPASSSKLDSGERYPASKRGPVRITQPRVVLRRHRAQHGSSAQLDRAGGRTPVARQMRRLAAFGLSERRSPTRHPIGSNPRVTGSTPGDKPLSAVLPRRDPPFYSVLLGRSVPGSPEPGS